MTTIIFRIESDGHGKYEIEAHDIWYAAADAAEKELGDPENDPCWDSFSFTVNDEEFGAEIETVKRSGYDIKLSYQGKDRVFNTDKWEFDDEND